MNTVDCKVTKVIYRKEIEIDGKTWVQYRVKAIAYGHTSICTLSYPISEEPNITEGFIFSA